MTLFELLNKALSPVRANLYDYEGRPITSIEPKKLRYSHNVSDIEVDDWKSEGPSAVGVKLRCFRQEYIKDTTCSIRENPCTWRDLIKERDWEHRWRSKK